MSDTERGRITPVELREVENRIPRYDPGTDDARPIEPIEAPEPRGPSIGDYLNVALEKLRTTITPRSSMQDMLERLRHWRTTITGFLFQGVALLASFGVILPDEPTSTIIQAVGYGVGLILIFWKRSDDTDEVKP